MFCEKERKIGEAEMMTMLSSCAFVVWGGVFVFDIFAR